jgi:hypothetical protein
MDNAKPQKGHNNEKSATARNWGTAYRPQLTSVHLTCNESELEVLMSEGESS